MYIISFIVVIIFLILYQKRKVTVCKLNKNLHGKTVIVTGGYTGTGLEIAKDLARRGARVIIAGPYYMEGNKALVRIVKHTRNYNVYFRLLNLASLKSVRDFAAKMLKSENRLDILINNAEAGIPRDFLTDDGMNFIMQANYYGHFLLTHLLLPLLKKTGTKFEPSRIISNTSNLREYASIDVDSYNKIDLWPKIKIYMNSKLSLVLFSRELAKRLSNSNVVVNCTVHGDVATGIYYSVNEYIAPIMNMFLYAFYRTPWKSAQTTIYMALDEQAGKVSGKVFENYKTIDTGIDNDIINLASIKLWKQSVELVKLDESELNTIY